MDVFFFFSSPLWKNCCMLASCQYQASDRACHGSNFPPGCYAVLSRGPWTSPRLHLGGILVVMQKLLILNYDSNQCQGSIPIVSSMIATATNVFDKKQWETIPSSTKPNQKLWTFFFCEKNIWTFDSIGMYTSVPNFSVACDEVSALDKCSRPDKVFIQFCKPRGFVRSNIHYMGMAAPNHEASSFAGFRSWHLANTRFYPIPRTRSLYFTGARLLLPPIHNFCHPFLANLRQEL